MKYEVFDDSMWIMNCGFWIMNEFTNSYSINSGRFLFIRTIVFNLFRNVHILFNPSIHFLCPIPRSFNQSGGYGRTNHSNHFPFPQDLELLGFFQDSLCCFFCRVKWFSCRHFLSFVLKTFEPGTYPRGRCFRAVLLEFLFSTSNELVAKVFRYFK